jgi:NTE family protein
MPARDPTYDHIVSLLRRFASAFVHEKWIEPVANLVRWISVPGGSVLFKKGQPSDSIYLVVSGLLGIVDEESAGIAHTVARLGPGEIIGEMGCITGQPRFSTVRALRSSEVLAVFWSDVERTATTDPGTLLSICKTLVQRLVKTQEGRSWESQPRTFALVSIGEDLDLRSFAERFKAALHCVGVAFLALRENCQHMTADEFFQIEKAHEYVIYAADSNNPSWLRLCLGQADAVLIVAEGKMSPRPMPKFAGTVSPDIPIMLVLTWECGVQPTNTGDWLSLGGASRHFHVRGSSDLQRVARLLTGRGFGLVLSGGGARGIAHVGVTRALREYGIDIDVIIGTSIGAFVGAAIALEWDYESMLQAARQFSTFSPLSEITFPRTSLLAGRHVRSLMQRWFADLRIEDMPIPYSCVSTNLYSAEVVVHRLGSLQTWLKASAAVPGVFPPVVEKDIVHVDGGVLNNMPTDLIRSTGAGFVVGVDVSGLSAAPDQLNILELLMRVGSIGDEAQAALRRKQCDVLISPNLANIRHLNFSAYELAIEAGYIATVEKLDQISRAKSQTVWENRSAVTF